MNPLVIAQNCFATYASAIDDANFETIEELFVEGKILDANGNCIAEGGNGVRTFYAGLIQIHPPAHTPGTQHHITNIAILEGNENRIVAKANFNVAQKIPERGVETIICGEYSTTFVRSNQRWTFASHKMRPRIIGDMSHHLTIDLRNLTQQK